MKKEKKLKLDTLSSMELESKEANQITGGILPYPICSCICYCNDSSERIYLRVDLKYINQVEIEP